MGTIFSVGLGFITHVVTALHEFAFFRKATSVEPFRQYFSVFTNITVFIKTLFMKTAVFMKIQRIILSGKFPESIAMLP